MAKKKKFDDPLEGIDPVMKTAFSVDEVSETSGAPIAPVEFPTLKPETSAKKVEVDVFSNIPVNVSVELGRAEVSLKDVYELSEGSIIELERLVGEPLDLVVNGQVVAQGEVVAIDNNYGLRVTHILASAK
ncbi:MAG: flagellar motor switch protein FliN [Candidatus Margulisiibacteriota bacterium]